MSIAEADVEWTAFRNRCRHYECLVLPIRLNNAPATVVGLMYASCDKSVVVHLDDILTSLRTYADHLRDVGAVLEHGGKVANCMQDVRMGIRQGVGGSPWPCCL